MALHPEVAAAFAAAPATPPTDTLTPDEARALTRAGRAAVPDGPPMAEVEDHAVAVEGGEIAVRRYRPAPGRPGGAVLWMHGGGWVLGDLDHADPTCRALAAASGCEVFSVDYRLAPEHRFPVQIHDAEAALAWIAPRATGPLVVGGDSAGGNLATVLARRVRDAGGPPIALQVLVYPVVDADATWPSFREHGDDHLLLGAREMAWFWGHYADPADRDGPDASPLHADLAGLPPALVLVAEYDPLRDPVRAYADALAAADVPTELLAFDDMHHGFFGRPGQFSRADEAIALVGGRIARAVG